MLLPLAKWDRATTSSHREGTAGIIKILSCFLEIGNQQGSLFIANNTATSIRRINIMNSPSQLLSVVNRSTTHSFNPATPTCPSRPCSIKMRELSPHCTRPDHHHNRPDSSERPKTRSGMPTLYPSRAQPAKLTGTLRERTPAAPSSDHYHHSHEPPNSLPPGPALSPTSPTTYLCTFCWRPHHPAVTPSRVVGRSARLACQPCYAALLDLAVCWVCGEVVFRGDECVSLGWCFWHRACYGCLMCGDRRVVEGFSLEQIFNGQDAEGSGGREVDEVPLCARCVEKAGPDVRADEEHLIPMALGRVERFDGGLSRRRWEARQQSQHLVVSSSGRPPLQQDVDDHGRTPSPIYVSSRDPLGEPSFRRSPTKPIPEWMQYLPNQKHATRDCHEPRPASILNSYFAAPGSSAAGLEREAGESPPPPPVPSHTVPVRQAPQTYAPVQMSRSFTFITEEPVQRPSSTKVVNKHVRFYPSTISPQQTISSNDRGNIPSGSSEFLDRYQVHTPAAGDGMRSSPRNVPSYHDDHHTKNLSPLFKCFDTNPPSSSVESALHVVRVKDEDATPSRVEERHPRHARSALELASRYGIAECRKDGENCHSSRHEGSHSPVSHLHVGGDGVLDYAGAGFDAAAKRPPLTFQGQLKRVFGFA